MFFFLYIFLFIQKKKEKLFALEEELLLKDSILSTLPIAWCTWDVKTSKVECSEEFKNILLLNDRAFITIEQIFHQLEAKDFSPLAKAMQHLLDFGGIFQIHVPLKSLKKEVDITGHILSFQHASHAHNREVVLLSCQDVTSHIHTFSDLNEKIKHIEDENFLLNQIMDQLPVIIWHRNRYGSIDYCNQEYAQALNLTKAKIINENIEFIDDEDHVLYNLSQKALKNKTVETMYSHIVVNGERRYFELNEDPLKNQTTCGYAIDVTVLESLELSLKEASKAYKETLNALSIPIAVFNENQRLSFYNVAYQKLFDFEKRILDLSPRFLDLLDDLRARRKMQEYADFSAHKKERERLFYELIHPIEEVSYLPDGRALRTMISPYPLGGLLFIFENITGQLDLERDVNTLLAVQKTTLDHLDEGIVVVANNGKITLINPSIYRVWGVEEQTGQEGCKLLNWLEFIKSSFIDSAQYNIWEQNLSKRFTERSPYKERIYLADQKVIEWFYAPLPDSSHMVVFTDVSTEWLHEKTLKSRNMNLELTQKLKNDYVQEMSVEISPPLEDILGFSDILRQEVFGDLNEKQLHYCQMIHDHAELLKKILNDVLESVQLDHDHIMIVIESFNIDAFLKKIEEELLKKSTKTGVDIQIHKKHKEFQIDGDEKRLFNAIMGIVAYILRITSRDCEISIATSSTKNYFVISFKTTLPEASKYISTLNLGKKMAQLIIEKHQGAYSESITEKDVQVTCKIPLKKVS